MIKKLVNLIVFIAFTVFFAVAMYRTDNSNMQRLFVTFLWLSIVYAFFKIVIEQLVIKRIKDYKTKYSFRKAISVTYVSIFLFIVGTIWIEDVQALLVAYGLVAAGVAFALQDIFKNLAGGIILLGSSVYKVGDRIELDGDLGDVIDVGILYTTILELREWVEGDQTTGRLTIIPNGKLLSTTVNNYTKDNTIIWDEITIPITYESNWEKANDLILKIVRERTKEFQKNAEEEISQLSRKYYLTPRHAKADIFVKLTDNWIEFYLRYVVLARERREVHNQISREILRSLDEHDDIQIASTTIKIVNLPDK